MVVIVNHLNNFSTLPITAEIQHTSASTSISSSVNSAVNSGSCTAVPLDALSGADGEALASETSGTADEGGDDLGKDCSGAPSTSVEADGSEEASAIPPFFSLRRRLRRRAILAESDGAGLGTGGGGSALREDDGGGRAEAARAASIPDNLEPLGRVPATRGRR